MSGSLKQIKSRIKSLSSTIKATKATQLVSSSKFKIAKKNLLNANEYFYCIKDLIGKIINLDNAEMQMNTFLKNCLHGIEDKVLVVVISSDRGLCGNLNSNIYKSLNNFIYKHKSAKIVSIGKKISEYTQKRYSSLLLKKDEKDIVVCIENILSEMNFRSVYVVYTHFNSTLSYEVRTQKIFPIFESNFFKPEDDSKINTLIEPDIDSILTSSLHLCLKAALSYASSNSSASEHAARMIAMDNATKNGDKMIKYLTVNANKMRQATITRELVDIVSGAQAL